MGPTLLASEPASDPVSDPAASADPALAPTMNSPSVRLDGAVDVGQLTEEQPGRYARSEELGRGGMGRVVLVFDEHLGREVAMKELLVQADGQASSAGVTVGIVTRFLREARVTGQLEHPGIVPVHELGRRPDGTLYYTMKRIRGRALTSVLADAKTMEERLELLIHYRLVCEAMAYAHSRGVVHRDLKPDNVMVGEFGETLIVDWGLAKVRGEDDLRGREISRQVQLTGAAGAASTLDGFAIGTPAYMSPEQARGDLARIDERSDVWGLGAMLFELLTGRPPHLGDKAVEVLQKVLDDRPPKVLEIEPNAPPELAAVADRALLRDPSSRYPGAEQLAAEIRAFQDGTQVHAYDYSSFEMARRFVSRNWAASVAALVIFLAVLATTLVSYRMYAYEREARALSEASRAEASDDRDEAERRLNTVRFTFARSLLEHAESALDDGDPAAAAIYAAGALLNDPTNPWSPNHVEVTLGSEERHEAQDRVARAFSAYLDAEGARRYVFVRRVGGASARGALSLDGRTLVFPTGSRLAIEPTAGGERRTLDVRADQVLTFVDDTHVVLTGDEPGVYSLDTGERTRALPDGLRSAALSSFGLAVGLENGEVVVFGRDSLEELGRFQTSMRGESEIAWAGPERLVVGGHGYSRVQRWPWPPTEGVTAAGVVSVDLPAALSVMAADEPGALVAVGLADPFLAVLSSAPFEARATFVTDAEVSGAAWVRDGLLASAEGAHRVVIRSVARGRAIDTLHLPRATGHRVLSAGGFLAVLPTRSPLRAVAGSIYHFERHRHGRARPLATSVSDVRVDPARRRVLVATLRTIESFPTSRRGLGVRESLATLPPEVGHPARLAVARDGAVAVVTDLGALLLIERGSVRTLFPASGHAECTLGLAFGSRGERILVGSVDGTVRRWRRSRDRADAPLLGHEGAVCGLSVSADGAVAVSASVDGTARIWSVASGALEREVVRGDLAFSDVALSPDAERIAVADDRGFISIVRRVDGSTVVRFHAHRGWIDRLAWSPDGLHVASTGTDHTVRYGTADGARVLRIIRTAGPPRSVEVSARGSYLYFHDGRMIVRLDANPSVDLRDPAELLRISERRAGLRLDGLELVPVD